MRLIRKGAFAIAAVAPTLTLAAVVVPPSTGAATTCHGQQATHIGVPGDVQIVGTAGPDVIVTNGVTSVHAEAGDDVICVIGSRQTWISAGRGNDFVDASEHRGAEVRTSLASDNDTYVGSPTRDYVQADAWAPGDDFGDDSISTGSGGDLVLVYAGTDRTAVRMGHGRDRLRIYGKKTGFRIDGGADRDWVNVRCECRTRIPHLELDLARGIYAIPRGTGRLTSFEDTFVMGTERATITGTGWGNRIKANVCRPEVSAGAGEDELLHGRIRAWCPEPRMAFVGGSGDDVLTGGPGRDRLSGGRGRDLADGLDGEDFCRAEQTRRCES